MTKNNKHSLYNLHGWFYYRTKVLVLAKKVTNDLPKFPQKFGQTQQQTLICQRFQSLTHMANSQRRDNIYVY